MVRYLLPYFRVKQIETSEILSRCLRIGERLDKFDSFIEYGYFVFK
jgi:hypothetical protein